MNNRLVYFLGYLIITLAIIAIFAKGGEVLIARNTMKIEIQEQRKEALFVDLCPGMPVPEFFSYPNNYSFAIQYVNDKGDMVLTTLDSTLRVSNQVIFEGDLCDASR